MQKVTIKQSKNVLKRKENSKSINTQNKYNGDWLKFIDYCKYKHNCSPTDVDGLESDIKLTISRQGERGAMGKIGNRHIHKQHNSKILASDKSDNLK